MSWMLRFVCVAAVMVGFVPMASAQDEAATDDETVVDPNDPSVAYKKKTEYDFEDDIVEGSFVRPDGEYIDARRAGRHASLIKIRENFVPEMLKSAEDI